MQRNIRHRLKALFGQRHTFMARVEGFGLHDNPKTGQQDRKVLLCNIRLADSAQYVAHHNWIEAEALPGVQAGDIIQVSAVVTEYAKGYRGGGIRAIMCPLQVDYRLDLFENLTICYRTNNRERGA